MRAVLIRHGQSTANIGLPSVESAQVELTELGWQQAGQVAASWVEVPTLIVTSPFLRARQSAQPTIQRFPKVPVEVWPIEEFTYLSPARWTGTTSVDRKPAAERYWKLADPVASDGEGAESFADLFRRAASTAARLRAMPADALVYLFGHGQFTQALLWCVETPVVPSQETMCAFRLQAESILNANPIAVSLHDACAGDAPAANPSDRL